MDLTWAFYRERTGTLSSLSGRPEWNEGFVTGLHVVFTMVQFAPIMFHAWKMAKNKSKLLKHSSPEGKRRAVLQRRGLFDFVSPFAQSSMILFTAFLTYLGFTAPLRTPEADELGESPVA